MILRGLTPNFLVCLLLLSYVTPPPAWAAPASLGTVRGIRGTELSFDGGKTWLPLGTRALPLMAGAQLRSSTGTAALDLTDGSRINVLPFSALRFRENGADAGISLLYGRLTFRVPERAHFEILTPSASLEPVPQGATAGEVFLSGEGLIGVKMMEGTLQVRPLGDGGRPVLASLEPVFLPRRPAGVGPFFSSDGPVTPPTGAKGVFTPRGESIGYLRPDGQLLIEPGFTADLIRPFSPKLVRLAMARIPEKDRAVDAVPLFDVNGGYVGYLAGPVFYAQAAEAPAAQAAAAPEVQTAAGGLGRIATPAAAIGVGAAAAAGAFSSGGAGAAPAAGDSSSGGAGAPVAADASSFSLSAAGPPPGCPPVSTPVRPPGGGPPGGVPPGVPPCPPPQP